MKNIKDVLANRRRALAWYYRNREKVAAKSKARLKNYLENNYNVWLWSKAKDRANRKNLEFSIKPEDIIIPILCPILKVPMIRNTPYAASIDRVDNTKGYIPGNVWVISRKANTLKGDASREELERFAKWVLNQ